MTPTAGAAPRDSSWRPYVILGIGLLAVSSASIFTRYAQQEHVSSLVIAAWRLVVSTLILSPMIFARHRPDLRRLTLREVGLAALSGLMLAIHFGTWISSLEYTSVITSTVLVTTHPLWVALLSPILLKERLSRVTLGAVALAFVGVAIISATGSAGTAPRQDNPLLGNALALLGAIAVAIYYMIGRRVRTNVSTLPYIWMTYGSAAIVMSLVVVLTGQQVFSLPDNSAVPGNAYLWLMLIALVPQLIGHSSFNYALGFMTAAFVSLTVLFEPIGSTILAYLLLGERPTQEQLVGSALILVALVVASLEESRRKVTPPRASE